MTSEIWTRNIPKFDGSDFHIWKFQIGKILVANGLLDIVDGTSQMPADEESDEAKDWVKNNAKAMYMISSTLDAKQLRPLITCTTAQEMWTKLGNIHEQKSASNKLILMQRFHEYRMASSDSVVEHVSKVQNLALQLTDIGQEVNDTEVMAKILGSLPSKFNALQTAWDSVPEESQTIDKLLERLIKEENRLARDDDVTSALAAFNIGAKAAKKSKQKQKKKPKKNKEDSECFRCGLMGHYARECPKRETSNFTKTKDSSTWQANNCAFVATKRAIDTFAPSVENIRKLQSANEEDAWFTDSGSSRHITFRREWLTNFQPLKGEKIQLGDNGECDIRGVGTVVIEKLVGRTWETAYIRNVLFVPELRKNLFSVGVTTSLGYTVLFKEQSVALIKQDKVFAQGMKQENDIYRMFFRVKGPRVADPQVNVSTTSLMRWHERLGHVNKRTLCDMVKNGVVNGVKLSNTKDFFCDACQEGKSHKLPFQKSADKAVYRVGEKFHSDVCGPLPVASIGGARFFVSFIDDASGYRAVYFIRHKSDVFEKFKIFERLVANKFGRSIKVLRSDNGREYFNTAMIKYMEQRGIGKEYSAPYSPEQNGKAERENRTVMEGARSMMMHKSLPGKLWAEAVSTAVYILNRTPSSKNSSTTPYELWHVKKPDLSHVRVFGSIAFAHIPKALRGKLDAKAERLTLVGYQEDSTNYRLFNEKKGTVIVSRHVTFDERDLNVSSLGDDEIEPELLLPAVGDVSQDENRDDQEANDEQDEHDEEDVQRGQTPPPQQPGEPTDAVEENQRVLRDRSTLQTPSRYRVNFTQYTPMSFQEAMDSPCAKEWSRAISEELESHEVNNTWSIVARENDKKLITSKWVFKIHRNEVGQITRYKARLVARGFEQKRGLDYNETFAPVVRYDSLRVFLAIVTQEDLEMEQFDVKTAFLHGELKEEIFLELPEGVKFKGDKNAVMCKLHKSLYGVKQAARCWNEKFTKFLREFNLVPSEADKCIFTGAKNNVNVYLALFVDDGLIASKSTSVLESMIQALSSSFEITRGNATSFVGLQIERSNQ